MAHVSLCYPSPSWYAARSTEVALRRRARTILGTRAVDDRLACPSALARGGLYPFSPSCPSPEGDKMQGNTFSSSNDAGKGVRPVAEKLTESPLNETTHYIRVKFFSPLPSPP